MSVTQTIYANAFALIYSRTPNSNDHSSAVVYMGNDSGTSYIRDLLLSFPPPSGDLAFREPLSAALYVYGEVSEFNWNLSADTLLNSFAAESVSWNTRPDQTGTRFNSSYLSTGYAHAETTDAETAARLLRFGVTLTAGLAYVNTPANTSNRPYAVVTFGDEIAGLDVECLPQSGSYPKNQPTTFSWTNFQNGECSAEVVQSSAVFRWRADAASAATETRLTTETSVTVPAGTFSTNSIQWQVEVTANSGAVTTSEWFTIGTTGPQSNTVPVSPVSTAVDGSAPITFQWKNVVSTGAAQTGADVQISADGSAWSSLAHVEGAEESYTVPANTFAAGPLYWRARTYTGGTAGLWSDTANVIVISAPAVSISGVTQSPRPTVSWQAEGQQAFQVRMGDHDSGSVFGTEKRYTSPEYLPDGEHTVRVRAQNIYGLWSEWAETAIHVENAAGDPPVLTVQGVMDAFLSWNEVPGAAAYLIYRDGERIAETAELSYTDRYAIGAVRYLVRAVYDGSENYTDSVEAGITLRTAWPVITAVDGEWIHLRMNTTALPEAQITHRADVTLRSFAGTAYPVPERSEHLQKGYTLTTAFKAGSGDISRFRALLGREVFLKDQYGNALYGVMASISETASKFYTVFSASVTQIEGAP